jgi:uncharacterized protein
MLEAERFTLVVGAEQQDELRDVLLRPFLRDNYGVPGDRVEELLDLIDEIELSTDSLPTSIIVRDPNDQDILRSALSGRVDFLVTGDDDLLVLAGAPAVAPLQIVTPRQFIELLESDD